MPSSEIAYVAVAMCLGLKMLTHLGGDRSAATVLFERGRHLLALAEVVASSSTRTRSGRPTDQEQTTMSTDFDHGGPRHGRYPGSPALFLVVAAFAWAILIILAAMTVPIVTVAAAPVTATAPLTLGTTPTPTSTPNDQQLYASPRVSVLTHDGAVGVAVAGIPGATSLLVGGLLWVGARRRRTVLVSIPAWTLSLALVAAGIVGFLTFLIGIVAVPTGLLLALACSQAAPLRPRTVPAGAGRS